MFRTLDYFVYAYVLLIRLKVGRFRRDLIVWLDSKQEWRFLPSVFENHQFYVCGAWLIGL